MESALPDTGAEPVTLMVHGSLVPIDREVFAALFDNSIVSQRAEVLQAFEGEPMKLASFVKLTGQAQIPYPLFFAPPPVVLEQVRLKNKKLTQGFTQESFSMHTRQRIALRDVELIVKDLRMKQKLLRENDSTLQMNEIVGLLRRSRQTVPQDAIALKTALGIEEQVLRRGKKTAAVDYLVGRLEAHQILVARSTKDIFMPQRIPNWAKFSGITLKDRKVPYLFLASGDEGAQWQPEGRKLFTLTLLAVLISRDIFAPVNYEGHSKEKTTAREYRLVEEILMPAGQLQRAQFADLDLLKSAADTFMVTPSAMTMRARHLDLITQDRFETYMDVLKAEFVRPPKHPFSASDPAKSLRKYNGLECSRRMMRLLDAGQMSRGDFRRIMLFNKAEVGDFRRVLS